MYQQASCLCCTSTYEGFPNTFLEAFSHGVPVVSTVDPDGVLAGQRLGAVAQDAPGVLAALRTLLGSTARWQEASDNARQYYVEHHALDAVLPQFEQVFLEVAARQRAGRRI
jgi:glycosyltransferase involved in cell wall biosynthesis